MPRILRDSLGSQTQREPSSSGRGRGDSCFYQRSIEEGEGAFGRNPREIQRSQSWDDRWGWQDGEKQAEQRSATELAVG